MIEIKPNISHKIHCPVCNLILKPSELVWQGIHVLAKYKCNKCSKNFFADLPVGNALVNSYIVDISEHILYGKDNFARKWLGESLLNSLQNPKDKKIELNIKIFKKADEVVILNCIDYLYGHSLLKLLNVDRLLEKNKNIIVIVPKLLEWMVPKGVTEIWIVNISIKNAKEYYIYLDTRIKKEFNRFKKIYLDKAYPLPSRFDIHQFTGIKKHDLGNKVKYRISFIWREDRPWISNEYLVYIIKKIKLLKFLVFIQYIKVIILFISLRISFPKAGMTVVGLGKTYAFPKWIQDERVEHFTPRIEKRLCKIYSDSRVMIGVHGSNMLLPSAHAGMVVDLVPFTRMNNFTQDILYQETNFDSRMVSYKYRYIPISSSIRTISNNIILMIKNYEDTLKYTGA